MSWKNKIILTFPVVIPTFQDKKLRNYFFSGGY